VSDNRICHCVQSGAVKMISISPDREMYL
jgi:hypothetical protein